MKPNAKVFAWLFAWFWALLWLESARHGVTPPEARAAALPMVSPAVLSVVGQTQPMPVLVLQAQGAIPMPPNTPAAHASNLLAMPAGHACAMMAFWFAGTRESAPDVQIASSCFERKPKPPQEAQAWSPPHFVVNRHEVGAQLGFGLRRLGNPVSWLDGRGRVHLFVVATGLGGWAAARIVHLRQTNEGSDPAQLTFGQPRVLPLSWLWNISTLVRAPPLPLQDGGMVLPVYFELGAKYPVALRFDADGQLLGQVRMSNRQHLLQPTLLPQSGSHWIALLRDQRIDGKIGLVQSQDAGQTWQDLPDLPLANPDASIVALAVRPDLQFLAHNSSPGSRWVLDLSASANGLEWAKQATLAQVPAGTVPPAGTEFSYPAMAWADGSVWVSFTDSRKRILWQRYALQAKP